MAHFAEINSDNKVLRVIVADTKKWCEDNLGGTWVQTSYNATFGGKFAGIGDIYDGTNFVSPELEATDE
jgi:hypothetical protein